MKKKIRILLNLGVVALFVLNFFVDAPNLNPLYPSGAFIWCVTISAFIGVNFLVGLGGIRIITDEIGRVRVTTGDLKGKAKMSFYVIVTIWALYFLVTVASSPLFNYTAYRDQISVDQNRSEFSQDIQPLDINKLPIVDKSLAYRLADKKLGEKTSLGSQVYLGEPVIQRVAEELVWVVPLKHSGFFKWLNNMSGTPGYIVVSATDVQNVRYVDGFKIKYQPNNFLLDDLNRHIRIFGGAFEGIIDDSFELDEEGRPYWVVTTYKNQWLFALPEATGVLLVDAETGAISKYSNENVPEWVDRVQPEDVLMQQINNQGQYVHGVFNFSNKDKFRASEGNIIIYNNDNCYLFTGLTSVGSDESAIGFILVDMVTKESKIYYMSGATERAAQMSAQGKVQQFGYIASFPMIINLDGKATYFMTLKDNGGLIKQYAFVSVTDFSTVGVGESVNEAKNNFTKAIKDSNSTIEIGGEKLIAIGTVERIASEQVGTNTVYKMIIREQGKGIYIVSYDLSDELALTMTGDQVKIEYSEDSSGKIIVTEFDNLNIG